MQISQKEENSPRFAPPETVRFGSITHIVAHALPMHVNPHSRF